VQVIVGWWQYGEGESFEVERNLLRLIIREKVTVAK
jgi:hypothetical protein